MHGVDAALLLLPDPLLLLLLLRSAHRAGRHSQVPRQTVRFSFHRRRSHLLEGFSLKPRYIQEDWRLSDSASRPSRRTQPVTPKAVLPASLQHTMETSVAARPAPDHL